MQVTSIAVLALFLGACATIQSRSPAVSILVDLDPASADRTVIVESVTVDKEGRLYLPDRVTGNILRVDTKNRVAPLCRQRGATLFAGSGHGEHSSRRYEGTQIGRGRLDR